MSIRCSGWDKIHVSLKKITTLIYTDILMEVVDVILYISLTYIIYIFLLPPKFTNLYFLFLLVTLSIPKAQLINILSG
jgi:hypothetical protein